VPLSWDLDTTSTQVVDLPRIHHVTLVNTTFAEYAQFFARVRVPADTHITLETSVPVRHDALPNGLTLFPPSFFSCLLQPAETTTDQAVCTLDIKLRKQDLSFNIYKCSVNSDVCDRSLGSACPSHLSARVTFPARSSQIHTSLVDPFSSFCIGPLLVAVDTLSIWLEGYPGEIPWRDVLAAVPRIREIRASMDCWNIAGLKDALDTNDSVSYRSQNLMVAVRRLEELHLSPGADSEFHSGVEGIADVVERRAKAGLPLERIVGSNITLSDEDLVRLRWIVTESVEWAGRFEQESLGLGMI